MEVVADTKKKVRVLVADDHPLYREGVVRALVASGRVEVVAQAEDGRGALDQIREHAPDVALIDYKLPNLDGVSVVHAVARDGLPTRVLMLSAFTDSGLVYEALQTGASGYLPKEAKRDEIVDAVLACARGETVLPPELTAGLVSELRVRRASDSPVLTDRGRPLPRRDDREDARPASVREARRLRPRRGGRRGDAPPPDRIAPVCASAGRADSRRSRRQRWRRSSDAWRCFACSRSR